MRIVDRGIVFNAQAAPEHERCAAFTSVMRTADGALMCSFKCGPTKLGPADRIIIMRSEDDGRTWRRWFNGFDTTFDGTPGSFTAAYLTEPQPGRLIVNLHWVDRTHPDRPLSNPETSGVLPMKCLLAESTNGGVTWSGPRHVSFAPHPGTNPTGPILALRDGALLLPYESWKEWDDVDGKQAAYARISRDGGATWDGPLTMATDPDDRLCYWDNHLAVDPDTGELIAMFWTHDRSAGVDVPIHIAYGSADGRTWTKPQPTNIAGQVVEPVPLGGDRLMCVYVHRHDPPSIRAVVSEDRGRTWDMDRELLLYDAAGATQAGMTAARSEAEYWQDMVRWTFGHPKATRLPDGSVMVVHYGGMPEALSIHWAHLAD
jgi:hypothetical protein